MKGRRRFFADCGRAALGLPLLSLAGCSRQPSTTPAPKDAAGAGSGWDELVADLEKQLPALLAKATTVPAVSMALVTDAKLRWLRLSAPSETITSAFRSWRARFIVCRPRWMAS